MEAFSAAEKFTTREGVSGSLSRPTTLRPGPGSSNVFGLGKLNASAICVRTEFSTGLSSKRKPTATGTRSSSRSMTISNLRWVTTGRPERDARQYRCPVGAVEFHLDAFALPDKRLTGVVEPAEVQGRARELVAACLGGGEPGPLSSPGAAAQLWATPDEQLVPASDRRIATTHHRGRRVKERTNQSPAPAVNAARSGLSAERR